MGSSDPPKFAKITDRFLAFLIDLLPFLAGYLGTLYRGIVLMGDASLAAGGWRRVFLGWAAAYLAYQAVANAYGATAGKLALGIRVRRLDGGRPGPLAGLVRAAGYVVGMPFFNLGFLWALFQRESRAWHDLLAATVVVENAPKGASRHARNALLAFLALAGLLAAEVRFFVLAPTPADIERVRKARAGLRVLAAVEEAHRAMHGSFTASLADLAAASGDPAQFRSAMMRLFEPDGFEIEAGSASYRLSGLALDRRRSRVELSGPGIPRSP
jgi:uncharacterized RDD family membrane protein YckC